MPSHKCSYFMCENTSGTTPMFRFPWNDENRLEIWLNNCGNMTITHLPHERLRTRYLCIDHFNKKYVRNETGQRKRLRKLAVPDAYQTPETKDCLCASSPGSPELKVQIPQKVYRNKRRFCEDKEVQEVKEEENQTVHWSTPKRRKIEQKIHDQDTPKCTAEFTKTIPYWTVSSGRVTDGAHEADQRILKEQALKITLAHIRANPQLYIGIPTNCYHLIELLHKQTHISTTHILLCLKKVKLDTHFEELADQFGIMADEAQDIFIQNIPILAKTLESFIVNMDSDEDIQTNNLLIPFRAEHHNTTSVIDSLELKVQPQTAKSKELTQTDRGNTVKYLISCTPNGLINYVSPGYVGRHSDERLLENTKYLERFQPGACIIVNNGFRNAEPMLKRKGLKLVRPRAHKRSPTFHGAAQPEGLDAPCSKYEDKRMLNDIERVVQRVRDYTMIRDHSVISSELVRVLDEAVVISCALINLQSFVIN